MDVQFFERLLATFRIEAEEHLKNISGGLVHYESSQNEDERREQLEFIYREAHSLKGAARAVSLNEIEGICQNIENVFAALKKNELKELTSVYDMLHESIDGIGAYLDSEADEKPAIEASLEMLSQRLHMALFESYQNPNKLNGENGDTETAGEAEVNHQTALEVDLESLRELKAAFFKAPLARPKANALPQPAARSQSSRPSSDDLLKISFQKLDHLYHFSEEMITSKLRFRQIVDELQDVLFKIGSWKKELSRHAGISTALRNKAAGSEQPLLRSLFELLELNHEHIAKLESRLAKVQKTSLRETRHLQTNVDGMIDTIRGILILPFSHLVDILPKMTRDIARDLGKEIELIIEGAEIEVEKRVLDEFKDPLLHLVRNAIDHGIESSAIRVAAGKPVKGKIRLRISQEEASRAVIEVIDDGAGIDLESLKRSAVKKNVITAEEADKLKENETLDLIFRSGLTTAPVITDLSGRGLGLAIVKEKIEKLNGSILVHSEPGKGSSFRITLPVTIASLRAITIRAGEKVFQLPTTHVQKIIRLPKASITTIESKPSIIIDQSPVPVVWLVDILKLDNFKEKEEPFTFLCIINLNDEKIAVGFSELLDEHEIVIKPFNRQLKKIRNISGASLTADGRIIPILDTNDLFRSARELYTGISFVEKTGSSMPTAQRQILVADDSITSRMLMKDILESAGYEVTTAIDGIDALTALKSAKFDLVVSDVEMPRMNGFDFTVAIRKDPRTAELPVVLVTGLSKREDRERGIDAGANAYVVKSSFDQSNLLEIIERLIL